MGFGGSNGRSDSREVHLRDDARSGGLFSAQFRRKVVWREIALWGGIAVVTFFVLNPYLWNEPFRRIVEVITFHRQYTQGMDVMRAGYPWWQPVIWVATALPWHPRVFFFLTLDEFIFWAGVVGLYFYGKKRTVVEWMVFGTVFDSADIPDQVASILSDCHSSPLYERFRVFENRLYLDYGKGTVLGLPGRDVAQTAEKFSGGW